MNKIAISEELAGLITRLMHDRKRGASAKGPLYWRLFGIIEGINFVEFVKDGIWTGMTDYKQKEKLEDLVRRADGEGEPLEYNYYAIRDAIRDILN